MERTETSAQLEFMIRSTILDRPRQLIIDPEYLEFDDKDLVSERATRFLSKDIAELRHGVKSIHGYRFRIGRTFCIDVRDISGTIIKIRFKSLYRIRRKQLEQKYLAITNALYRYYFHDMMRAYLQQLQMGEPIDVLGVNLNRDGVLFDEKVGRVSWDFLGTKRFWHYYTLFSMEDPNMYRAFVFLEDWNAGVLRSVIEAILKHKFPNR